MDNPDPSATPRIEVERNGPYVVTGNVHITRRAIVNSPYDEPMTWQTTADLGSVEDAVLCRCGGSSSKPFCDDTHVRNHFVGPETAATSTYDERAELLGGTGMTIRKDSYLCQHTGFCGNRFEGIRAMAKELREDDTEERTLLMAMIEHCPSGALTFRVEQDSSDIEPELRQGIGVTANGPYFVTGGITIWRSDGEVLETRNRVTLCRCGKSSKMPLCDATHRETGFADS